MGKGSRGKRSIGTGGASEEAKIERLDKPQDEKPIPRRAGCIERCLSGSGRGSWKPVCGNAYQALAPYFIKAVPGTRW
jgi:hypothetical protein